MKTIASSFALLLGTLIACAQTESEFSGSSSFGLKAGLNLAKIGGDASGVESKPDFHVGLFWIDRKSETFAIMPELVFSRQGAQASSNSKVKINYDYVNLPIMLCYFPSEQVFLQAGPQLGVLVSGKITDGTNTENVRDQLNNIDFSLGFGFGGTFDKTVLLARYNLGINNTAREVQDNEKYPNQVFQISVGLKCNNGPN